MSGIVPLRVFIVAGQSNMVRSDSKVTDIQRYAQYVGLEKPQKDVRISYSIGRENRKILEGWIDLHLSSTGENVLVVGEQEFLEGKSHQGAPRIFRSELVGL